MNFYKRLITWIILISIFLFSIYVGGYLFATLIFACTFMAAKEFFVITQKKFNLYCIVLLSLFTLTFASTLFPSYLFIWHSAFVKYLLLVTYCICFFELLFKTYIIFNSATLNTIKPLLICCLSFPFLILIRDLPNGMILCIVTLTVITSTDTYAYLIGRKLGKHRFTSISPKKTIEGSFAGILAALIFANICAFIFSLDYLNTSIFALVLAIVSQFGDIYESLVKRTYSLKDSSDTLPGHGGFFDRSDSYLFILPFVYFYSYLIG